MDKIYKVIKGFYNDDRSKLFKVGDIVTLEKAIEYPYGRYLPDNPSPEQLAMANIQNVYWTIKHLEKKDLQRYYDVEKEVFKRIKLIDGIPRKYSLLVEESNLRSIGYRRG